MRRSLFSVVGALVLTVSVAAASASADGGDPAIVTVHPVAHPRGVVATSGGWAYCQQVRRLARRFRFTLICGRYYRDGYTGYGLRSRRQLDWGEPAYLASLAKAVDALHDQVGGELVLLGVSYSGFGVATLASHHPELRPDRLIVIDSYLDLEARRAVAGSSATGKEIDAVTGGSAAALASQNVSVTGLGDLVRGGAELTVIWTVAPDERREFRGATCNTDASARVLAELASVVGRPILAWVTQTKHGHNLWDSGRLIMAGRPPGHRLVFAPGTGVPAGSTC